MTTVNDVLEMPLETLLAVFFNVEQLTDRGFAVVSDYRETKFLDLPHDSHLRTTKALSEKYRLAFYQKNNTRIESYISNPGNYTLEEFRHLLYKQILKSIYDTGINYRLDEEIALALFIFRGSADFTFGYYAVDLKFVSEQYIDDFYKMLLSSSELINRLNLNFRQLQPQYLQGIKRNTQVRINLKWFYDHVIRYYSDINEYKSKVLSVKYGELGDTRTYDAFVTRLIMYRQKVVGRELNEREIDNLRKDIEADTLPGNLRTNTRNQKIVSFAREAFPDECVGCRNKYKIQDRSFIMPRNGRYYFEINHVVPYANDNERVDVLDNLVKLCPTCHRALTPGRASESLQREIIHNMVESRPEVKQFVLSMDNGHFATAEDYVYSVLK